ncbi:MAG: glycosyltransferase [Rhodovibrionaceae bacterium]
MDGKTTHILIFEPDPRGHAREWLGHLLREITARPEDLRVTLVVAKALMETLRPQLPGNAQAIPLGAKEQQRCTHGNLLVSAFSRWRAMRRYLLRTGASRGLFLSFDHLALPYALGLGAAGRRVSGVLFRPTAHYAAIGCAPATAREKLRDRRKDLLLRLALRNRAVERVFSLDPYFPAFAAERYAAGGKLAQIGDPAFPAVEPSPEEHALADEIPRNRVAFLLFGELTERKGALPLLEALKRLPPEIAQRTAVMLAGRVDDGLRAALTDSESELRGRQPKLWLKIANRWLSEGEVTALVRASDVVLAPYQRFVGSSGVLLWAARAGRPVICQDYGLLGRLTENYGLGVTVDSSDPSALAAAIEGAVESGSLPAQSVRKVSEFLAVRTPQAFAAALLEGCGHRLSRAA